MEHRIRKPKGSIKKTCSKCHHQLEIKRQGKHRYCLPCHAEYMRLNRPKHRNLPEAARLRANARAYLHTYIKRGKIKKKPCIICGSKKLLEAHYEDYNKPLEVIWYCRKHHLQKHAA